MEGDVCPALTVSGLGSRGDPDQIIRRGLQPGWTGESTLTVEASRFKTFWNFTKYFKHKKYGYRIYIHIESK